MLAGSNFPIDFRRELAGDFTWAYRNGMFASYQDSLTGSWAVQTPMLYTLARLHREPELTTQAIDREFFSAFAPAEREVRAYFDFWREHCRKIDPVTFRRLAAKNPDRYGTAGGGNTRFTLLAADLFPAEMFIKAQKLLDAAESAAEKNPLTQKRIRFLRAGLTDARLTRECRARQIEMTQAKNSPDAEKAFRKAFRKMCEHRAEVEGDYVCNFGYLADCEADSMGWPHPYVKLKREKTGK